MTKHNLGIHACLLALSLAASPLAAAQAPGTPIATTVLPQTPAAQQVKRWLDVAGSSSVEEVQRLDPTLVTLYMQTGGLDLISVDAATATRVVVTARERQFGNYINYAWTFSTADQPRLTGLSGVTAPFPTGVPPLERLDDKALAAFVEEAMTKSGYSGTVLIARDGKPVYTAARGLADREQTIANTLDTRFRVGSVNKIMTAVAIMQLVQSGQVKLDAPLATYLKNYPNKDFAGTVTVHHLLTHTGGASDYGPQFAAKRLELKTLNDYVALFSSRPSDFPPGDDYRYTNSGFILLGSVIEAVSGQSYPDYMRDHVFKPAGMTRTGFEPENVDVEGRAKGYTINPQGAFTLNTNTLPYAGTSDGGGYSTARDMLAFTNALTGHKLLDAKHTALLTTKKVSNGYAYGFDDFSHDDARYYGHGGGAPGMNAHIAVIGDGKAVVVALSNVRPPGLAGILAIEIEKRMRVTGANGKPMTALGYGTGATPQPSDAARLAAFKAADTDTDGKLDKPAFRKALQQVGFADVLETLFRQRDADKDGFISADEYSKADPQQLATH